MFFGLNFGLTSLCGVLVGSKTRPIGIKAYPDVPLTSAEAVSTGRNIRHVGLRPQLTCSQYNTSQFEETINCHHDLAISSDSHLN